MFCVSIKQTKEKGSNYIATIGSESLLVTISECGQLISFFNYES